MSAEYTSMANSFVMWLACAPGVAWVLFQAFKFYKRSRADSLRMGITEKQVKSAIRSASIASVGPCFVMLTAMLSLMINVGAPLAWLRVDFIGSISYELMGANFAADAMGIQLGGAGMNADFLAAAAIVMTTGCVAWVLFAALLSDKMEKVNSVMSGGKEVLVPAMGAGAVIGCYASLTLDRIYPVGHQIWAVFVSGGLMAAITIYNKKANIQWLKEWGLSICMIVGMIVSTIVSTYAA